MTKTSSFSIMNKGLRYRLAVAFSLMTVIPLLSCLYVIYPFIFPKMQTTVRADVIFLISLLISMLGLTIAKNIIDTVINMADQTHRIAGGEYERKLAVSADDELGNLGQSINVMAQKIKSNLNELKNYGQDMKELNLEMHKKVLVLSSLLQIGDVVAAGASELNTLLNLAVEKAAGLFDTGYGALYLPRVDGGDFVMKTSYNIDKEKLDTLVLRREGNDILDRVLSARSVFQIDKDTKATKDIEAFKKACNVRNVLAVPLYSNKTLLGLFLIGNRLNDFAYTNDDVSLVSVFAKHVTIAIESDIINRKNDELMMRDDLTGLFNKRFIISRLEEELKRAIFYQRPCSFIMLNIDDFKKMRQARGELVAEEVLKGVAKIVKDNAGPVGKAARLAADEFGMLLPEKNKREAAHIAEDLRKKIEAGGFTRDRNLALTVSIGVSENPIDGSTADEIFNKASDAVRQAKADGKNRVVS